MTMYLLKQKTAYERRISDWSSDVCTSDLSCSPWRSAQEVAWAVPDETGAKAACPIRRTISPARSLRPETWQRSPEILLQGHSLIPRPFILIKPCEASIIL